MPDSLVWKWQKTCNDLGLDVTVIEMINQVMAPLDYSMATIVQQHLRMKGWNCAQYRCNRIWKNRSSYSCFIEEQWSACCRPGTIVHWCSSGYKTGCCSRIKTGPARGIWVNEFCKHPIPISMRWEMRLNLKSYHTTIHEQFSGRPCE